jgi:hypothetical protein
MLGLVASVVFPFGSEPAILSERQALEVASALSAKRNLAAQSAAQKIRDQARVNLDADETRKAVDLVPEELAELAAVMNEVAWPDDEPEYARLRRQLNRA